MTVQSKDINMIFANGKSGKLPINVFDLNSITGHPAIIMIAKRGSGKSWVVRAIMEYFKDIPVGTVISPTDRMSEFYAKFFPDTYIHYTFKSELIKRILDRQKKIIKKAKDKLKENKKIDTRASIIMDDCLGEKGKWIKDETIKELLFNGRHYHIMYILTMQFPLGITPELRMNFDYIFLLAEDYVSNLKRIYDHYAGMFPSFDTFRQVFKTLTDDFGCMVIVNKGVRKSLFDKIFWYKAPNFSDLKVDIGCKQFKQYHEKNYNKNWQNDEDVVENDPEEYMMEKKKNKMPLIVNKIKSNISVPKFKKKASF